MPKLDDLFGLKEGITGPMGSGKTNEFITRLKRLKKFAGPHNYQVIVAKPEIDIRDLHDVEEYPPYKLFIENEELARMIDSRDGLRLTDVIPLRNSSDLYGILADSRTKCERQVLGLSEIEFLDSGILDFMASLDSNVYFLWEGLVSSFRGEWFELSDYKATMQDVAGLTDRIDYKRSICEYPGCTRYADFTQRFTEEGDPEHWSSRIVVIGARQYQARCELHHQVPGRREAQFLLYPINWAGEEGIPKDKLELIGNSAGINETDIAWILGALEREKKINVKDDKIFPNYQAREKV